MKRHLSSAALQMLSHLALIGLSTCASAQVNKCTVDGKTVYQQGPCAKHEGSRGEIKLTIPSSGSLEDRLAQIDRDREAFLRRHCAGKNYLAPVIGMPEADLPCIRRYRDPERINVTKVAEGETKQYVFRGANGPSYIYFRDGLLSAIQEQQ